MTPGVVTRSELRLVFLIASAIFISNIDRGNLAIAGPLVRSEFHLSATSFGILISCFYWTYTACINPAAWVADRFGARRVLALCVALWSVATGLTGLATGFIGLLLVRLLLGVGESGVWPCSSSLVASELPPAFRGRANAWMAISIALGPAVGTFAGGLLMGRFGWRTVFMGLGAISLAWLWPWFAVESNPKHRVATEVSERSVPLKRILRERALWGSTLANVSAGYTYYFMISWMPIFLVQGRGLSLGSMGQLIGAAYLLRAGSSWISGPIIDRWINAGRSATVIHKGILGFGSIAIIVCLAGFGLGSSSVVIAGLFVYEFFAGLNTTATGSLIQLLAGPRATGTWVGFSNGAASLAGIVAPAVTGLIIDITGGFVGAFALAAAMATLGFIGWVFVVPRATAIEWGR
jgi:MFS family permease